MQKLHLKIKQYKPLIFDVSPSKIEVAAFVISVVVFASSLAARIYFSNTLASKNYELDTLQSQRNFLEQEISKLEYENLTLSSLKNLEIRAKDLGFLHMTEALSGIEYNALDQVASSYEVTAQ